MRIRIAMALGILTVGSVAFAAETGFEGGNDLTVTNYTGSVWAQCQTPPVGAPTSQFFRCEGNEILPGSTARFVTDAGGDADTVELIATWASGKTATQEKAFDASTGKSKGDFNLAISTLFQHPLLGMGLNRVHFKLKRGDEIRREGDFQAAIHEDPVMRQCETGTIYVQSASLCNDSFYACDRYFQETAPSCH